MNDFLNWTASRCDRAALVEALSRYSHFRAVKQAMARGDIEPPKNEDFRLPVTTKEPKKP